MRSWLVTLLLLTGCASAPIRQTDLARLTTADARVLEGCYRCLLEARDIYARVAVGRARPLVVGRLFEVELLIGLREAELAQNPAAAFARADALAPELPPASDPVFLMELARAIPPDAVGTPRAVAREAAGRRRAFIKTYVATAASRLDMVSVSPELRGYLAAALTCLSATTGVQSGVERPSEVPATLPPLVRYRMATCPLMQDAVLDGVTAQVPAFIEAAYFRARMPALRVTAEYVRSQRAAFTAAADTFPESPSVAYSLGALNQTVGDCRAAVTHYDRALALAPRHEDAALQRVICLGYQGRHENAINAATRMIEATYDNTNEAYYWRAWNRHRLRQLAGAREDIDRALARGVNARALTLGGIIKYDQGDLGLAERDLGMAVKMDRTQCLAQWYLGLVAFARELWLSTGEDFAASAACYRRSAEETERQLEAMRTADLDPDFKASQVAGFQAVIQDDRSQEQASYLNAANGFVRSDRHERARDMLAGIPDDSPHAPGAHELRRYLDELGAPPAR
ncbi:MAG: tetratricopeptide repeat protein [Acidobacteria bacterium]|nr:tetratricopeptide repeat protein [Acidobacteriota bacterium]